MPDFTITKARNAGEKDNPHGGKLVKWYIGLQDAPSGVEDVYVQKKPGNDLSPGMEISGRLEKGEYGWRLFPEQQQGGNFQAPAYKVEGTQASLSKDQYWNRKDERDVWSQRRMGRAHAQHMALLREANLIAAGDDEGYGSERELAASIDWFDRDVLDADVGSSQAAHGASPNSPSVAEDAADLSVEPSAEEQRPESNPAVQRQSEAGIEPAAEASPQQKGALTKLFHEAGLSREAMKAVVLFRCGSEKATKQGASQLITDLQDGATHDALLAEIYDASRAGNPLGTRAAALIPTEVPWDGEGLPPAPAKDDEQVPF